MDKFRNPSRDEQWNINNKAVIVMWYWRYAVTSTSFCMLRTIAEDVKLYMKRSSPAMILSQLWRQPYLPTRRLRVFAITVDHQSSIRCLYRAMYTINATKWNRNLCVPLSPIKTTDKPPGLSATDICQLFYRHLLVTMTLTKTLFVSHCNCNNGYGLNGKYT